MIAKGYKSVNPQMGKKEKAEKNLDNGVI